MQPNTPVPHGYHTVTPYLIVRDAEKALAFYADAFGAEVTMRLPGADGEGILHAEMKLGDSVIMLADENVSASTGRCPIALGGTSVALHLYVADVDRAFRQAVDSGCKVSMPLYDAFWGDRYGKVIDPFGHEWSLSTRVKEMTNEEIAQAAEGFLRQPSA